MGVLERKDNEVLNRLIVYLALPALVFGGVYKSSLDARLLGITAVAWVTLLVTAALAYGAGRLLRLPAPTLGGFVIVCALGNTGYLGYPLTIALFGKEELVKAFFYDIFGTAVALLTLAMWVGRQLGEGELRAGADERAAPAAASGAPAARGAAPASGALAETVRQIATFPALIAVVAGLALKPLAIPGFLLSAVEHLANLTVPLVMLTIGVSLEIRSMKEHPMALGLVAALKLAVAPALAWGLWVALKLPAEATPVVLLEASMPSMMLTYVVALKYRLDTSFVPTAIVLTTIASLVTVPLWQVALRTLG